MTIEVAVVALVAVRSACSYAEVRYQSVSAMRTDRAKTEHVQVKLKRTRNSIKEEEPEQEEEEGEEEGVGGWDDEKERGT